MMSAGLLPVAALMQVAALVVYMEKPPKMLKGSAVHIVTTREELVFQIDDHLSRSSNSSSTTQAAPTAAAAAAAP